MAIRSYGNARDALRPPPATANAETPKGPAPYRMPAEWEPHEATWLVWPRNPDDWPGKTRAAAWAYVEMIRRLLPGETVHVVVRDGAMKRRVRATLEQAHAWSEGVHLHLAAADRSWARDSGAIFVHDPAGAVTALDFGFTGWAKYRKHAEDDKLPRVMARRTGVERVAVRHGAAPVVLEGGAIDVDGAGRLLTTEECLLDQAVQVRNPGMHRATLEAIFARCLGAREVIWLGRGIAGDDTHGHVDDLCRFVGPGRVVLAREANPKDLNHGPLRENRTRLEAAGMEVIDLPMPEPLWFGGMRLPASYANFYIANAAVLVPTFNDPADRYALGILADCFPDRPVVGIHAVDLVWGQGTIHCLTKQQPRPVAAR